MNNAPLVSKPPNLVLDRVGDRAANNVEDNDLNIVIADLSPHRVNSSILLVDNRGMFDFF